MSILKRKRVMVLGAGASKALHQEAPLNSGLLSGALELIDILPDSTTINHDRLRRLRDFIYDFYPLASQGIDNLPYIEDVLTLLDRAIFDHLPLASQYPIRRLKDLRDDLVYAICEILNQRLMSQRNDTIAKAFFERFHRPNDVIISVNYDLLIDNLLSDNGYMADYGFIAREQAQYDGKIRLYKLHGSLNWLRCPRCEEVEITEWFKAAREIFMDNSVPGLSICQVCYGEHREERYEPLLITPTYLKAYDNPQLNLIWSKAEHVLNEADEVVFVGYSLPDSDVILRSMFSRALFANRKKNTDLKVCAVSDGYEAHERYRRVFGNIDYEANGFEEYIERGLKTEQQLKQQ